MKKNPDIDESTGAKKIESYKGNDIYDKSHDEHPFRYYALSQKIKRGKISGPVTAVEKTIEDLKNYIDNNSVS